MQSFKNKNIVITGAASGIGRSLSNEFAKEGAQLILCDLDTESLESHACELRENNTEVSSYYADVSNYDSMKEFSDKVLKDHNHIDVLINNAGVNLMDRFINGDLKDFKWVMDINFWGTVYGVNLFLENLLSRDEAHIVNISSILGLMSLPGQAAYNSSKAAIKGFTEALKMELTDTSVNVTCIHPGGVKTNIAGLVEGASKGEGLGNKFLGHIRETQTIIHVVRCFEDNEVTHVNEIVDPISDVEIIEMELILSDIETLEKTKEKIVRKAKSGDKDLLKDLSRIEDILTILKKGDALFSSSIPIAGASSITFWCLLCNEQSLSPRCNTFPVLSANT